MSITEERANEIVAEILADFDSKRPIVVDGTLTDGDWREWANLADEETFYAQCRAWGESFK